MGNDLWSRVKAKLSAWKASLKYWEGIFAAAVAAQLDEIAAGLDAYPEQAMSKRSRDNLATVRPDLQRVIRRAWMMRGNLDFEVICGHRGEKEQNEAFDNGHSNYSGRHSKHNRKPSWAVDVIPKPIPRTSEGWEEPEYLEKFDKLAHIIIAAANVEKVALEWGGRWPMRDLPHWEVVE